MTFFYSNKKTSVVYPSGALRLFFFSTLLFVFIFSCKKENPEPPGGGNTDDAYSVIIDNQFSGLGSDEAAWLSDADGVVRAFAWLDGLDTAHLRVPDAAATEQFDLTVFRLRVVNGQGTNDSTYTIKTYQNVNTGKTITMRNNVLKESIVLDVKFEQINSLEAIFFHDGLTFQVPSASNNWEGRYLCEHTGQIWFRVKANGNPIWQYAFLDNVEGDETQITINDVSILPDLFDPKPHPLSFPFLTYWNYDIQAITDLQNLKFLSIGDILRAPGGALPIENSVDLYQPKVQDIAKDGYRLNILGSGPDYTYRIDRQYQTLPDSLPALDFSLESTTVSGPRIASVFCNGTADALVFNRSFSAGLATGTWEAWTNPTPNTVQSYRLPDVPSAIAVAYPALATYPFQGGVEARYEHFDQLTYQQLLDELFKNTDPVWRMRGGYLGYGIEF